jgi:hypothetical protein
MKNQRNKLKKNLNRLIARKESIQNQLLKKRKVSQNQLKLNKRNEMRKLQKKINRLLLNLLRKKLLLQR